MVLVEEVMDTSPAPEPEAFAGIQKLRGRENYNVWKFQMKNMLIHEDLWFPISGYPEGDTTEEATKVRNDQKALSKINLTLSVSCIPHTMRAQTACEAWHALENVYEDKGRVNLLQKLLSMQKEDHVSVEDYISDVTMLSEQIAQTGNPVDEEILGVVLLRAFPKDDTFKALVMSLEDSGATLTSDIAKRWLMSYNDDSGQTIEVEEIEEPQETACVEERRSLFRWFRKTSTLAGNAYDDSLLQPKAIKNVPQGRGKEVVCLRCNQPGHLRNQCTNTTTDGGAAGPSNDSETTSMPKKLGKALIETAAETIIMRGAVAAAGAAGGALATAVTVGAKAFKKK